MEIMISHTQDTSPAAIMQLQGALDGSSYEKFVTEAQNLYDAGTRNLILDMSGLTFLSSAGLAGLHRIARVYAGEDRSTIEEGWSAIHSLDQKRDRDFKNHVKLLNPNKEILDVLDTVGFKTFFEIYADIHPAMASFQ